MTARSKSRKSSKVGATLSSSARLAMATDEAVAHQELLTALNADDWSVVLEAVSVADNYIRRALIGDPKGDEIVLRLVELASHPKWEVRRAVANTAAHVPHSAFEHVLAKLAIDQNTRVKQAAEQAALRRRDSRHASTLGKQHEERINSTLDDIEARFGSKGRDAVKRAAEQIANTFARELYHEVIRLLSPLAASAERLRAHLSGASVSPEALAEETDRIGRRVAQLRAVLDAMRAYTAQPALSFQGEVLREVIQEAASVAVDGDAEKPRRPVIEIDVPPDVVVDLARGRFVQALTNVLANAVESYREVDDPKPIEVRTEVQEGLVTITVEDAGCGMSDENQRDALTLFATSKPNGTGFGLPLAVKIVESEHGGRLNLDSLKGRGTIVRITIPTHHPRT
jgi:nitrogen fixation/metabolism regulation signal transduction histidine kinase